MPAEMRPDKAPLSVAIITRDEEANIAACLESVSFARDIVVVDSGSSDRTVEIAKEKGCRVFVEEWKGYGPQKNSAVSKCANDWVLILDADERVPPETRDEIITSVKNPVADAYGLPRKNFFHGRWIRHCDWWPDESIRLVRKSLGRFERLTHERWVTEGKSGRLLSPIEHYSFGSYSDLLRVVEQRTNSMAREMYDGGRRTNTFAPVIYAIGMFLRIYLLKSGFLDGFDGLVISLARAEGVFYKFAKLLEIQRLEKEKK